MLEDPQSGCGQLFSSISEWIVLIERCSTFPPSLPVPVNAALGHLGKRVRSASSAPPPLLGNQFTTHSCLCLSGDHVGWRWLQGQNLPPHPK